MNLSQLHPYIVHFPIAFLTAYFIIELLALLIKKDYLSKCAHLILFIGILSAVAAVLSGNSAYSAFTDWDSASLKVFNEHETYANISMWYFSAILVFRTYLVLKKKFISVYQVIVVVLAAIGVFFILNTGFYGGELVNKFGINKEFRLDFENK